jgi:hypothetical protein
MRQRLSLLLPRFFFATFAESFALFAVKDFDRKGRNF